MFRILELVLETERDSVREIVRERDSEMSERERAVRESDSVRERQ